MSSGLDAGVFRLLVMDFVLVVTIVGLVWLGRRLGSRAKRIAEQARTWPVTDAVVTRSQFVTVRSSENSGNQTYFYIVYKYMVEGKEYTQSMKVYDEKLFEEFRHKYIASLHVPAWYDPSRAKRSTLDRALLDEGKSWSIFCYVAAAILVFVILVSFYVMASR